MKCVDLEDSDDVGLMRSFLCGEEFEVDVLRSFASALSCSNAFACCGVCVCVSFSDAFLHW